MSATTLRTERHRRRYPPLQTLAVEVTSGPDAGARASSGADVVTVGSADNTDLRLSDPTVSRYHADLRRVAEGVLVIDHGSTNGTICGCARIERAIVPAGTALQLGHSVVRVTDGEVVAPEIHEGDALGQLRGKTPAMRRLMAELSRLAPTSVSVLIEGETGTGKDLVARCLHECGTRPDAPFVVVDCGALNESLAGSELFGHEQGAFTGATGRRIGAVERAHGGTLFLDEIGDLPAAQQAMLLGVLSRGRLRRVGGDREIPVTVRLVSATHRDLRRDVNDGRFRLDLYYRLAVACLRLPPLRQRSADIPLLVRHFARELGAERRLPELLETSRLDELAARPWPGNVRELRNWVEARLVTREVVDVPGAESVAPAAIADHILEGPYKRGRAAVVAAFERRYLERLLVRAGGNVSLAARLAALHRSSLIELLKRYRDGE